MPKKSVVELKPVPELELKHWIWVVDWALEKCSESIADAEREIVRHERFKGLNERMRHGRVRSRDEAVESLKQFHDQYCKIHDSLAVIKENLSNANAEEFAREITAMMRRGERIV